MIFTALAKASPSALAEASVWLPERWEEGSRGLSERTLAVYGDIAARFQAWLLDAGLTLADATRPDVLAFLAQWPAPRSRNLAIVVLKHIYTEAQARGLSARNPVATLRAFKVQNTPRDYLRVAEVNDLFHGIAGESLLAVRDRALLAIAFETGMRRSELVGLRCGDLGTVGGYPVLSHTTKGGGGERVVSRIRPHVADLVAAWQEAAGPRPAEAPLFCAVIRRGVGTEAAYGLDDPMRPLSPGVVALRLQAAMAKGGVKRDKPLPAHAIRRSLITNALENGAPLYTVQRSVHHTNPVTTEGYDAQRLSVASTAADFLPYRFDGGDKPPTTA
jgi:site-specific recombinase XerD